MKAEVFVKKNGLEQAKIALSKAISINIKKKVKMSFDDICSFYSFCADLKRIVESHDFVDLYGGVDHLKEFIKLNGYKDTPFSEQAFKHIDNVEKCQ